MFLTTFGTRRDICRLPRAGPCLTNTSPIICAGYSSAITSRRLALTVGNETSAALAFARRLQRAMLEEHFVEFGQGMASMSPALRDLEQVLLEGELAHGEHPV